MGTPMPTSVSIAVVQKIRQVGIGVLLADAFQQEAPFHVGKMETRGFGETVWRFGQRRPVPWGQFGSLVTTSFVRFLNVVSWPFNSDDGRVNEAK